MFWHEQFITTGENVLALDLMLNIERIASGEVVCVALLIAHATEPQHQLRRACCEYLVVWLQAELRSPLRVVTATKKGSDGSAHPTLQ